MHCPYSIFSTVDCIHQPSSLTFTVIVVFVPSQRDRNLPFSSFSLPGTTLDTNDGALHSVAEQAPATRPSLLNGIIPVAVSQHHSIAISQHHSITASQHHSIAISQYRNTASITPALVISYHRRLHHHHSPQSSPEKRSSRHLKCSCSPDLLQEEHCESLLELP